MEESGPRDSTSPRRPKRDSLRPQPAMAMFILLFAYPFLGMAWHHSYPVFTLEVLIYMLLAGGASILLALLLTRLRVMVANALIMPVEIPADPIPEARP